MPWPSPSPDRPSFPREVRMAVLRRDQLCVMCGEAPSTEVDHIIPVSQGGTAHPSNAQGVCSPCHRLKTNKERGLAQRGNKRKTLRQETQLHCGLINTTQSDDDVEP